MKNKSKIIILTLIFILSFLGLIAKYFFIDDILTYDYKFIEQPENIKKVIFRTKIARIISVIKPEKYYNPDIAKDFTDIAILYENKDENLTIKYYYRAANIYKILLKKNPSLLKEIEPEYIRLFDKMGNFYCTKSHEYKDKDNEKAISYYLKAVDAFNTLIKIKPQYIMEISDIYNAIGSIYENGILYDKVHQSEKAKEYYLKAYKIKHKIMTNNPDEITVYEDQNLKNLTNINEKLKDYGEAEKNYLETIKRFENLLDKNTKDSSNVQIFEEYTILNSLAVANFELADFYLKVENYSGAQAYYFKTLNLSKIILNKSTYPRNGFHFNILNAIGEFYYKTQKFDKAENYYLMALDESYKIEGPTSFSATDSQKEIKNNLGDLYTKSGQIDKANRYYAEAKQL